LLALYSFIAAQGHYHGLAFLGLVALLEVLDLLIEGVQIGFLELEPGKSRLIVDGDGGAVLPGLLHVVDMDVVAEHAARIAVCVADRRAGEGNEGGIGQGVAQVLGIAPVRR